MEEQVYPKVPNPTPQGSKRSAGDKRWLFAHLYVRGRGLLESYQRAYHPDQSGLLTEAQVNHAEREFEDHRTQRNIQRARDIVFAGERISLEQHLLELKSIRDEAMDRGNLTTALRAEKARGECVGLYSERHIHLVGGTVDVKMSLEEVDAKLAEIASRDPSLRTIIHKALPFASQENDPDSDPAEPAQSTDEE